MRYLLLLIFVATSLWYSFCLADTVVKNPDGTFTITTTTVLSNSTSVDEQQQELDMLQKHFQQITEDYRNRVNVLNNQMTTIQTRIDTMNSLGK